MKESATILYLVRHGETEANTRREYQGQNDTPLTEKGRAQARLMGRRLREIRPDTVYSSDLGRSMETARIACDGYTEDIAGHEGLRERNFGILQGVRFDDAESLYPDVFARYRGEDPDYRIPEGETWKEFLERINAALAEIAQANKGKTSILFTHGGVIGYYVAWLLGFTPGNRRMAILNGGFTRLSRDGDNFTLLGYGDTHHMDYPDTRPGQLPVEV